MFPNLGRSSLAPRGGGLIVSYPRLDGVSALGYTLACSFPCQRRRCLANYGFLVTSPQKFYGWKLIGVLFMLDFLNMGFPFFGGAVINTYMLKQIPMARSTYGLGFSLLNLFIGLPSVLVAAAILRWSARAAFAAGSALICLGALWLSLFASKP